MYITIVIPVHNEQENIQELVQRIQSVNRRVPDTMLHILFVDDGSSDATVDRIMALRVDTAGMVGLLKFDRNYGHQNAMLAGIVHASGDAIITMDGDLQHPPESIIDMLAAYRPGVDVVQMVRQGAPVGYIGALSRVYHGIVNRLEGRVTVYDGADFRLMSAKVSKVLQAIPERGKCVRVLVPKLGFKTVQVPFEQAPRFKGKASYSLHQLGILASAPLFKYSSLVVRLMALVGLLLVLSAFGAGIVFGPEYLTIVCILFFSGINFAFLAALGKLMLEAIKQLHQHPEYGVEQLHLPNYRG